jgi:hypothetical protein
MRWTLEQLDEWLGREALDADAETVGTVIATFVGPEQDEQLVSFYGLS